MSDPSPEPSVRRLVPPPAFCLHREFGPEDGGTVTFERHYLAYSARGVMRLAAASRLWSLHPSKAAWIPAGTPVTIEIPASLSGCSILLATDFAPAPSETVRTIELSPLAREMILHSRRWGEDGAGFGAEAAVFFRALIDLVAELARNPTTDWIPRGRTPLVARAVDLTVASHACALTIGEIAERLHVADRTLSRRVAEETGMTWAHLLRRVRVLRARELLASGELSVTRVAEQVGYSSQSAFNKAFREESETTPRAFRARYR